MKSEEKVVIILNPVSGNGNPQVRKKKKFFTMHENGDGKVRYLLPQRQKMPQSLLKEQ